MRRGDELKQDPEKLKKMLANLSDGEKDDLFKLLQADNSSKEAVSDGQRLESEEREPAPSSLSDDAVLNAKLSAESTRPQLRHYLGCLVWIGVAMGGIIALTYLFKKGIDFLV